MDEVDAEIDRAQLLEQRVYNIKQFLTLACIGNDGIYHLVVAVYHSLKLVFPRIITFKGKLGCGKELVGKASKGANHHNYWLFFCLFLYNSLETKNALHGTYRGSAKL